MEKRDGKEEYLINRDEEEAKGSSEVGGEGEREYRDNREWI